MAEVRLFFVVLMCVIGNSLALECLYCAHLEIQTVSSDSQADADIKNWKLGTEKELQKESNIAFAGDEIGSPQCIRAISDVEGRSCFSRPEEKGESERCISVNVTFTKDLTVNGEVVPVQGHLIYRGCAMPKGEAKTKLCSNPEEKHGIDSLKMEDYATTDYIEKNLMSKLGITDKEKWSAYGCYCSSHRCNTDTHPEYRWDTALCYSCNYLHVAMSEGSTLDKTTFYANYGHEKTSRKCINPESQTDIDKDCGVANDQTAFCTFLNISFIGHVKEGSDDMAVGYLVVRDCGVGSNNKDMCTIDNIHNLGISSLTEDKVKNKYMRGDLGLFHPVFMTNACACRALDGPKCNKDDSAAFWDSSLRWTDGASPCVSTNSLVHVILVASALIWL